MHEFFDKDVLVHPSSDDPANRQGQVGKVTNVVPENDEVYVVFEDQNTGIYSQSALLTLKPLHQLMGLLRVEDTYLAGSDWNNMMSVYLLKDEGGPFISDALQLAKESPLLLYAATVSLQDWTDQGLSEDFGRSLRR